MAGPDPKDPSWVQGLALVSQLGLVFAAPVVLGALIGKALDARFNAGGLILVAGVLLGVAAGAFAAYRIIAQVTK